jgi:hypothetical protein
MKKLVNKVKEDNERGARENLIEELFFDFNRNRTQIYVINFIRGLFFGLGSVIGGTIVVGLLIWLLTSLTHVFPPLSDFVNSIMHTVQQRGK